MYNPYDHYFKKAKKEGYKARSAFKLEEIQNKFKLFGKNTKNILDIGCSPGSWIQYAVAQCQKNNINDYHIIGFDIKKTDINIKGVQTFIQDITDIESIKTTIDSILGEQKLDLIMSDMAPNTTGIKDIDSMRSMNLIEQTIQIYDNFLKENGKFVIKLFMGPGFEEFLQKMRSIHGGKKIKIFKPSACRKGSKETYLIKI